MHSLLGGIELLNLKSLCNINNLVLGARSEFNRFAGTGDELFCWQNENLDLT